MRTSEAREDGDGVPKGADSDGVPLASIGGVAEGFEYNEADLSGKLQKCIFLTFGQWSKGPNTCSKIKYYG